MDNICFTFLVSFFFLVRSLEKLLRCLEHLHTSVLQVPKSNDQNQVVPTTRYVEIGHLLLLQYCVCTQLFHTSILYVQLARVAFLMNSFHIFPVKCGHVVYQVRYYTNNTSRADPLETHLMDLVFTRRTRTKSPTVKLGSTILVLLLCALSCFCRFFVTVIDTSLCICSNDV